VTARGNERKPIYRDDRDRERFLEILADGVNRFRLVVHAYVLMRNHYHLLLETGEANLSRALRHLNGVYTQFFNRRHRRVGHLFQGRFKALVVEKEAYLVELSRYIHLNAVRVGEVRDPAAFAWSSAGAFVGRRRVPTWLRPDDVLAVFGRRLRPAQRAYAQFLAGGAQQPWGQVVGQTLLGSPGWVDRVRRMIARKGRHLEIPATRQLAPRPALQTILDVTARRTGVTRADLLRPHGTGARAVAMHLGYEVGGLRQAALAKEFGVTPFAAGRAVARTRARLRTDHRLRQLIQKITADVQT